MLLQSALLRHHSSCISRQVARNLAALIVESSTPTRYLTFRRYPQVQTAGFRTPAMERPTKRAKLSLSPSRAEQDGQTSTVSTSLESLHRSITPPPRSSVRQSASPAVSSGCPELRHDQIPTQKAELAEIEATAALRLIPSPVQLTHIRDFPASKGYNVDTVKLRDILGDPLIRECWQFNYCFDVDFLMSQFDEDVRGLVQVKVVHGSWERESANRIRVDVSAATDCLSVLPHEFW